MRLNRFLAAAGLGSRRQCDELIAEGRVTVNGQPCTNFSTQIEDSDHVKVGHRICPASGNADHDGLQAGGFVSTRHDPNATDTIYDLLPSKFFRLFNVGRLDARTRICARHRGMVTSPSTEWSALVVEKEYEVTLGRLWDPGSPKNCAREFFSTANALG